MMERDDALINQLWFYFKKQTLQEKYNQVLFLVRYLMNFWLIIKSMINLWFIYGFTMVTDNLYKHFFTVYFSFQSTSWNWIIYETKQFPNRVIIN